MSERKDGLNSELGQEAKHVTRPTPSNEHPLRSSLIAISLVVAVVGLALVNCDKKAIGSVLHDMTNVANDPNCTLSLVWCDSMWKSAPSK